MSAAKDCARNESRVDKVNFGDLPQLLGYQIRQVQTALFKDFSDSSADIRVTPGEFSLLTLIDTNPGVSQTALMSVYKVDKSTLSLSIRGLQKRGLVRRVRGQLDQRFQSLWLTEAGVQSLQRIRRQVDRQERAMDACLRSGERAQLLDMLTRIRRAFDQTSLDHRERGRKD
ncbi:MAG TPA: MarR family transcriptional regulator [Burkholderiaceae bacterium]|nr:MarR family transcriptional regulator [Burkholderiaceae bacterium]